MKQLLTALYFLSFMGLSPAQQTVMPAHTKAAIQAIRQDLANNRNVLPTKTRNFYPIYQHRNEDYIAVLCKVNSTFSKSDALRDGFDVGAVVGHIAGMRIPLYLLSEEFNYPGIEYLEVAGKIEPELDGGLVDTRANLVHQGFDLPQPYTGKGVLIGVVDWGFDYTHPTFYDTTLTHNRIVAAWDQEKRTGTPPDGFSHGAVYSNVAELIAAQTDTVSNTSTYHGTHVAGIAGGSGAGTIYRGIAFESDLLFSQMRRDVSSSLDAFEWMYNVSQATGKRLVINNSWGNYRTNPLDGTSLISQAIDAYSAMGVTFINSGANNGGINFHLKKTFNQDSVKTRIMGFEYGSDNELWGQTVNLWGEAGHPFSVQFRVLNALNEFQGQSTLFNTATLSSYVDTFMVFGTDTVFYNVYADAAHPLNGRPQLTLNVKTTNSSLRSILYVEAIDGTVHMWNTRLTIYGGGNTGKGFTAPINGYTLGDRNYGVGHPAVTSSAITVAAHITNSGIASFSSYGPRMDEVIKPEISAPGEDICSALNFYSGLNVTPVTEVLFNGNEYGFFRLSGTSMSAPMVTGIVALLLEADPNLQPDEIKAFLIDNARTDGQTGAIGPEGNVRWGYGKADAYSVIQSITGTSVNGHETPSIILYPNPACCQLNFSGEINDQVRYILYGLDARPLASGFLDNTIDISFLQPGIYMLQVETENAFEVLKFGVVR